MATWLGISRLPLIFWRRLLRKDWERDLKLAAHISQIVLVIGGVAGYFLTIQPINQKEKLEEDMVALNEQARIRQAEAQFLKAEIELSRETMRMLEVDRQRLAQDQARATQQIEEQRRVFDDERRSMATEHLKFTQQNERERHDLEARHADLLRAEAARARTAEHEAEAHAALLERLRTFDRIRNWITKTCVSPKSTILLDMVGGQINACIHDAAIDSPDWPTLSSDDQARIREWSVQANRTFRSVVADNPRGSVVFGQLVIDELFSTSAPCASAAGNREEMIELKRPDVIESTRCISTTHTGEIIGELAARYSALQLSIEAAIAGAADRKDPSMSFIRPNPPTGVTIQ